MARDDLEFVTDVTKFKTKAPWGNDPFKDVPTQVKSAFTRYVCICAFCLAGLGLCMLHGLVEWSSVADK